jgi:hypothetical protein
MPDQNYAVPIKFAFPLLERAGWKSAEPAEDQQNSNANTSAASTNQTPRDARANSNQTR